MRYDIKEDTVYIDIGGNEVNGSFPMACLLKFC